MITNILLLIISIGVLIKSANWLIDGASSIAKQMRISEIMIGLTIVAFGTSAPEFAINVFSAIRGNPDIAFGNILGSNISNILLILGIGAVIHPLVVRRNTVWKEIPLAFLSVLVLFMLAADAVWGAPQSMLTRGDGVVLLSFFIIFLYYTFGTQRIEGELPDAESVHVVRPIQAWGMIVGGASGVFLGGNFTVESAVGIATALHVSQSLIALTIISVGTSLPELVTVIVAAVKRKADIAVGGIVGSNLFNIFFVLGATAVIHQVPFARELYLDLFMTAVASLLLFFMVFFGKKGHILARKEGIVFLVVYVLYIIHLVSRG